MFDEFEKIYPEEVFLLKTQLGNNSISHAYLFETNDNKTIDFINFFAFEILKSGTELNINLNNYDNFFNFKTENKTIKKEEIAKIKNKFNKKSSVGKYSVYIVNEAEKLNSSSANALLKFLEEPEENIVAILITNNIYNVIDTIISRCQIINLKNDNKLINIDEDDKLITLELVENIENYKQNMLVYSKNYFKDFDYKNIKTILELLLYFYKDILNYNFKREVTYYSSEEIKKYFDKYNFSNIDKITRYIKELLELLEINETNINKTMLFDMLCIKLGGSND